MKTFGILMMVFVLGPFWIYLIVRLCTAAAVKSWWEEMRKTGRVKTRRDLQDAEE